MDEQTASAIKAMIATYAEIRRIYYDAVFVAVYDYLDSGNSITSYKNTVKRAMVDAFTPAAEAGWEDGGGVLPMDDKTNEWLTTKQAAELGYIDLLFISLKEMRAEGDVNRTDTATTRAEGYAQTLDTVYNHCKVAGAGKSMLTFVGEDGAESCNDCRRYKNQRHKASWWIAKDAVPPNRDFECKGYHCQHVLVDDDGKVFTI